MPRTLFILSLTFGALTIAGCGGDDADDVTQRVAATVAAESSRVSGDPSARAAPTPPPAAISPAASPVAGTSPMATESASVEVVAVVGVVDEDARRIEINRLSGAEVSVVEVPQATVIQQAGGTRVSLADVRPSDRIVAKGRLSGGGALIASEITVQVVSPGGSGGG